MQQQQYERYASGPSFQPVATPNVSQAMEREQAYLLRDQKARFKGQQANTKMELLDLKFQEDAFKKLGAFSETLTKQLVEREKTLNEEEQMKGLRDAYVNGVPESVRTAFDQQMEQLNNNAASTERQLNDAVDGNQVSWALARELSNMSPHTRVGYAKGILQQLGQRYPQQLQTELLDALAQNPGMSVEEKNQRMMDYRYNWMQQSGLGGFNPALLDAELFPAMKRAEAVVADRWAAEAEQNQREMLGEDANMLMRQPYSQSNWDTATELQRARGLTRAQARTELLKQITDVNTLDQWASLTSFDGKTTLGEKFSRDFTARRNSILQEGLGVFEYNEKSKDLAAKQYADQFVKMWENGEEQPTDYDIEQIKLQSQRQYGRYDPRLDQFSSVTVDAERDRLIRADLDARIEAGDDISTLLMNPNIPADIRAEYTTKNKGNVSEGGGSVKQDFYSKQLEQDIYQNIGTASTPLESKKQTPGALIAVEYAQSLYAQRRAELITGGMSPGEASQQAYREINKSIIDGNHDADKGPTNPSNPFNFHQVKGYYNMLAPGGSTQSQERLDQANTAAINKQNVDTIYKNLGPKPPESALLSYNLIPKNMLQDYVQNSGDWTYEPPEIAKYISDKYYRGRISPWQIMQRQAKFQLGEEGTLPPSILRSETMSPKAKGLLYHAPSYNRIGRTYRQMNAEGFDPSLVPGHYGGMIVEAANANGIDPAVLAGLVEQESLWDPNAVSRVGAVGLGQFMPDTAAEFGVDRTDPQSSIDGAARYLRYLINYFGGNEPLAIYAYNGGMGNIEKYGGPIPGNRENEEYYDLVMERATRYGYRGYVPGLNPALKQ